MWGDATIYCELEGSDEESLETAGLDGKDSYISVRFLLFGVDGNMILVWSGAKPERQLPAFFLPQFPCS